MYTLCSVFTLNIRVIYYIMSNRLIVRLR